MNFVRRINVSKLKGNPALILFPNKKYSGEGNLNAKRMASIVVRLKKRNYKAQQRQAKRTVDRHLMNFINRNFTQEQARVLGQIIIWRAKGKIVEMPTPAQIIEAFVNKREALAALRSVSMEIAILMQRARKARPVNIILHDRKTNLVMDLFKNRLNYPYNQVRKAISSLKGQKK